MTFKFTHDQHDATTASGPVLCNQCSAPLKHKVNRDSNGKLNDLFKCEVNIFHQVGADALLPVNHALTCCDHPVEGRVL